MVTAARGSVWMGAGALVAATLAAPQPAAAFFDELARAIFSGGQQAPVARYADPRYDYAPAPRVRQRPVEQASRPTPPAVKLDPEADPYWYLKDPTLRRGDIVVTANGPVVFHGTTRSRHAEADFAALGQSRLVSRSARQLVSAATDTRLR